MDGGGGAPVWGGNELKKTGARSARARTRGQNPLVFKKSRHLGFDVFVDIWSMRQLLPGPRLSRTKEA
jgi:hypothetical protein